MPRVLGELGTIGGHDARQAAIVARPIGITNFRNGAVCRQKQWRFPFRKPNYQ
jgi:hypothetical protein